MLIYPIVSAVAIIFSGNRLAFIAPIIIVVFLSIVVGFRSPDVGIDTIHYYGVYEQVLTGFQGTWMERQLGYLFIYSSLLADFLGFDASFVTFVYALLTLFFLFLTIYRFSECSYLSVALFLTALGLFFYMHNVMRQALAISIIFFSVRYIINKNWLRFYLVAFSACLVHLSAVFFLPFYYLARLKVKPYFLIFVWVLSIPFIFYPSLSLSLINAVDFLIPRQYLPYLNATELFAKGGVSGFGLLVLFKQIVFLFVLYAYKKNFHYTEDRVICILYIYFVIVENFTINLGLLARFNGYLGIFVLLALPLAIKSLVKKDQRSFSFGMVWFVMYFFYIYGIFGDGYRIFNIS